MKKSYLIHAVWAIVAVIAFAVGTKQVSKDESADNPDSKTRPGARYVDRSQGGGSEGRSNTRRLARGNRSDGGMDLGGSGRTRLSESGIKSLGNLIKTSTDPIERRIAFTKLLEALTPENAMLMREQIEHMSSRSSEWREFHYAWGALVGQKAVDFGAESEQRDMAACLSGWASADPGAVMTWFDGLSEERTRNDELKWGAVYGMANNDPELATQFVMKRAEAGDRQADDLIELVAESIMRSGSMEDAARWSERLPKGELQDSAVREIASDYAREDPVKAVAWLESLPEGSGQTRGMGSAFSRWASRDAEAAANKINQMQESPLRDSAIVGYSRTLSYRDPSTAIDWANSISNAKMRDDALVRYGRIYMERDREAASRWLSSSDLSPALQKRIVANRRR